MLLSRRRVLAAAAAGAAASGLSACGLSGETAFGSATASDTVLVGSADFTESQIIAEVYVAALKQRGFAAQSQPAIGAREAFMGALLEGSVGVVPDYTGNLLLYCDGQTDAVTDQQIVAALKKALPQELALLTPAAAENKDSMVVTAATAERFGLVSLADCSKHQDRLVVGAPPEFAERSYGLAGLRQKYGFVPAGFSPINDGGGPLTLQALLDGDIQLANLFSTDPEIDRHGLVVLEDPRHNFLAQQVVPVVNARGVSLGVARVLDEVSAVLTTQDLIAFNGRVSGDEKANAATVAQEWVQQKLAA